MRNFLGIVFLCAVGVFAQTTGVITGTVTDASGAVIANAKVTATNNATGLTRVTQTGQSGVYTLPALPVGTYVVSAEVNGFKKKLVTDAVLEIEAEKRVDFALEVGQVTESVTVSEHGASMQTENATVGQVIDNRFNSEIPLNGRDFSQLVLLTPGTTTRPGGYAQTVGAATGSLGSGVSIGGRDNQNNFTLDGAANNARQFGNIAIKPSIDAIQEFKVQTNSYGADVGHAAFGQVSLITKSGTNQFHGSLFEFFRNDVFDARNTFLPTVSRLNRNQFGAAVGGPVKHDRTFFFFNWEMNKERRATDLLRSVPIQAWRDGDFSGVPNLVLKDPSTGLQFPGNKIPSARFSTDAKASIALWPTQNFGTPTTISNNLFVNTPDRYEDNQILIKIDHQLTSKDRLSGSFSRAAHTETTLALGGGLPGDFVGIAPPKNKLAVVNWTHIFNPRMLGEFRASYTRSEFVQTSPNSGKVGYFAQFGINNPLASPVFEGAPTTVFTKGSTAVNSNASLTTFGDGDFNTQRDISNEFNEAGSVTWTKSSHTIRAGFDLTRFQQNTPGPVTGQRRGSFSFSGDFTGHAFGDFLLGDPLSASHVVGKGVETGRSWWHGYCVTDDWKFSRKLTVNFGLRYEYVSPLLDILDRRSTFWPLTNDYGRPEKPQVIVANSDDAKNILGLSGVGLHAVYKPDRNNFAPRLGFAYSVNDKTVFRMAYGVFYTNSQTFLNNFVINRRQPPFAQTESVTSSTATPQINIANPFVNAAAALVISTQNINPNFQEGYVQQWNATIQRDLPFKANVEIGYSGSKGTKLQELVFYNVPTPGPTTNIQSRRPFPTWGTALSEDSYVNSNYNSLQIKAVRRSKGGMTNLIAYTWAKSIDSSSSRGNGDFGGGFTGSGDERNRVGYSRSLSGFDVRQRLVYSSVFELPMGTGKWLFKNAGPMLNKVVGGWETAGISTYQSGFPFTVAMSADVNGDGVIDRPDLIGPVTYNTRNRDCYVVDAVNPACNTTQTGFRVLPAGSLRFGSAGRNILIGPGLANYDLAVGKNTRFGHDDRYNVQFRAEFFNFLNRPNYNNPITTINSASTKFGVITSASAPRVMQFTLKTQF